MSASRVFVSPALLSLAYGYETGLGMYETMKSNASLAAGRSIRTRLAKKSALRTSRSEYPGTIGTGLTSAAGAISESVSAAPMRRSMAVGYDAHFVYDRVTLIKSTI